MLIPINIKNICINSSELILPASVANKANKPIIVETIIKTSFVENIKSLNLVF